MFQETAVCVYSYQQTIQLFNQTRAAWVPLPMAMGIKSLWKTDPLQHYQEALSGCRGFERHACGGNQIYSLQHSPSWVNILSSVTTFKLKMAQGSVFFILLSPNYVLSHVPASSTLHMQNHHKILVQLYYKTKLGNPERMMSFF